MNSKANSVLSQMLGQYQQRHNRLPEKVVLAPLACLALAIRGQLAPTWRSIPLECREISEAEATKDRGKARSLGVFVLPEDRTARLVSCDLQT